jgi:hypothetical protein
MVRKPKRFNHVDCASLRTASAFILTPFQHRRYAQENPMLCKIKMWGLIKRPIAQPFYRAIVMVQHRVRSDQSFKVHHGEA